MNRNIRLISILEKLVLNKKVCVKELANYYNLEPRVIQLDFKDVLNIYFGDRLIKTGDCYSLIKREQFHDLFNHNHKTSKQFLKFLSMVDSTLYRKFEKEHKELIKGLKLDSSPIYQIENSPYEKLKSENREILGKIEESIANRRYVTVSYKPKEEESFYYAHSIPIKILYLNENWYLALLTTNDLIDNSAFKQLRVNFITAIKECHVEPRKFDSDNVEKIKAENFLKQIQSAYSSMDRPTYKVLLKVSVEVARYFKKKKYLKSQRVVEELEDGDIVVSFEISDDMEIVPIVQRWIPFVEVIEPLRIGERVEENIRKFVKGV